MERKTRKDLEAIVAVLNRNTDNRYGFSLGKAYGGYRLECYNESRDVSPRLSTRQMYDWLHAFSAGLDYAIMAGYVGNIG